MAYQKVSKKAEYFEKIQFSQPGDQAEGHLVERVSIPDGDSSYRRYTIIQAKDGKKGSFFGTYQLDRDLAGVKIGSKIRITFEGREKIKGGKIVCNFCVEVDSDDIRAA